MDTRARLTLRLILTAVLTFAAAGAAFAQPELPDVPPTEPAPPMAIAPSPILPPAPTAWQARPLKVALGATFVGLQAADVATTLHAVHHLGAREANPAMMPLVKHPTAFIAVKSLTTLMVLGSTQRLSKTHPKKAALLMVALNVGYAAITASNYRQIARASR